MAFNFVKNAFRSHSTEETPEPVTQDADEMSQKTASQKNGAINPGGRRKPTPAVSPLSRESPKKELPRKPGLPPRPTDKKDATKRNGGVTPTTKTELNRKAPSPVAQRKSSDTPRPVIAPKPELATKPAVVAAPLDTAKPVENGHIEAKQEIPVQNGESNGALEKQENAVPNGQDTQEKPVSNGFTPEEEQENLDTVPEIKMRGAPRAQPQPQPRVQNGAKSQDAQVMSALTRGLTALQETEQEQGAEDIKILDTQLDHLNECLDTFEKRVDEHTAKIQDMLDKQKQARLKRRASFQQQQEVPKTVDEEVIIAIQRMQQSVEEDEAFSSQVQKMLGRCNQSRRASVPEFPESFQQMMEEEAAKKEAEESKN